MGFLKNPAPINVLKHQITIDVTLVGKLALLPEPFPWKGGKAGLAAQAEATLKGQLHHSRRQRAPWAHRVQGHSPPMPSQARTPEVQSNKETFKFKNANSG